MAVKGHQRFAYFNVPQFNQLVKASRSKDRHGDAWCSSFNRIRPSQSIYVTSVVFQHFNRLALLRAPQVHEFIVSAACQYWPCRIPLNHVYLLLMTSPDPQRLLILLQGPKEDVLIYWTWSQRCFVLPIQVCNFVVLVEDLDDLLLTGICAPDNHFFVLSPWSNERPVFVPFWNHKHWVY